MTQNNRSQLSRFFQLQRERYICTNGPLKLSDTTVTDLALPWGLRSTSFFENHTTTLLNKARVLQSRRKPWFPGIYLHQYREAVILLIHIQTAARLNKNRQNMLAHIEPVNTKWKRKQTSTLTHFVKMCQRLLQSSRWRQLMFSKFVTVKG